VWSSPIIGKLRYLVQDELWRDKINSSRQEPIDQLISESVMFFVSKVELGKDGGINHPAFCHPPRLEAV